MPDKPGDTSPRGRLKTIYDWLTGVPEAADQSAGSPPVLDTAAHPTRIGHYAIDRKLGEGGMGVVYAARDERLERTIAVKTMASHATDNTARQRFWREARTAASINHPNICQIYEIGEDSGTLFIAMELLQGESLADRLRGGPMSVSQAVPIGLDILAALTAMHSLGLVHRDLKPSNVFLTPHGAKVLDFGLARLEPENSPTYEGNLTRTGMLLGSPRYMAPEQVSGGIADVRSDLFAAGAILFEMLAGRPAFGGRTIAEILHATLHEQPPALTGSPAIAAFDRVIRRALAKRAADRPASAAEMADELRGIPGVGGDDSPARAHTLTRLVVLPFRVLRPDPDIDFLTFSLADAIATSLSGNASLIVRSTAAAARFAGDAPDLKALSADADVDRVVIGTLLRSGDQVRAATQLVEAPGGTLIASHTVQSSLGDLFQLQDDIARRVADALALPLSAAAAPASGDRPHDPRAYELYLRANELSRRYDGLPQARELYEACLERDPRFAPAWARLGRCHRVIGKYVEVSPGSDERAEEAYRRALSINPHLSLAHKYYANLEADIGQAPRAVNRLLGEAARHGNDPELFAGLVHACRYCGLYEESMAAYAEARRLDPNIPVSVEQTVLMTGDVERLLTFEPPQVVAGADNGIRVIGLGLAGRRDEAKRMLDAMKDAVRVPVFKAWTDYLMAWLEYRPAEMEVTMASLEALKIQDDPEAIFQFGWLLCDVKEYQRGLEYLERAVAHGYSPAATLERASQFDALREVPAFVALLAAARASSAQARTAFATAGGERLVGLEAARG